jgi:hypothetical protein
MSETKRTKHIAFRLTDEEYTKIEKAVAASGDEPNNRWRIVLTASQEARSLAKPDV